MLRRVLGRRLLAGHSHWENIKHQKGRIDEARAKHFHKLSRELMSIARGHDETTIHTDPAVQAAIQRCKAVSVPKDVIQKALDNALGRRKENLSEIMYQVKAPNGFFILVFTMTDNPNRTKPYIWTVIKEYDSQFSTVVHAFHQKWLARVDLTCSVPDLDDWASLDERVTEVALELPVNDIWWTQEGEFGWWSIETDKREFSGVISGLTDRLVSLEAPVLMNKALSGLQYLPKLEAELTGESLGDAERLLKELEELEDVDRIVHNLSSPSV